MLRFQDLDSLFSSLVEDTSVIDILWTVVRAGNRSLNVDGASQGKYFQLLLSLESKKVNDCD